MGPTIGIMDVVVRVKVRYVSSSERRVALSLTSVHITYVMRGPRVTCTALNNAGII